MVFGISTSWQWYTENNDSLLDLLGACRFVLFWPGLL